MIKKLTSTAVATLTILTMMNTGAVFADSKDANEKEPVALVNVEKLNIRSGPSISYDIIGSFEKEDSVDLISLKDGSYKIKLEDGKKAWTNGQYITLDGEVTVDKLNECTIGHLIYFFELACAMSGRLLEVNPFNQPGVEKYKKNMFRLLGKPGYVEEKKVKEEKAEKPKRGRKKKEQKI